MTEETKDILSTAISDVGYWQWWDEVDNDYMVEFGGVLLYDESKKGKMLRSSSVAIGFWENAFLIFLDNNDDSTTWFDDLHNDAIDPFTLDPDGFIFDDKDYAIDILSKYKRRHGPFSNRDEAIDVISKAKNILAATCGDFGFIAGGDLVKAIGSKGDYTDEDISRLSKKWWEYWEDYWKKRETEDAYEKDYACEVTIPLKQ